MAQDLPPDDVLLELGRLIWSAITLERVVYTVCRSVRPRHGAANDYPIGARIDEAVNDIHDRPNDGLRQRAVAWLEEAKVALDQRNSVVHGDPSTYVSITEDGSAVTSLDSFLVHFPRDTTRPTVKTPLTVDGLKAIRLRLEQAYEGWIDLSANLWERRHEAKWSE